MIFANHMYGGTMGTLQIDLSNDGGTTWTNNVWSRSGNQGDVWNVDTVAISTFIGLTNNMVVRFRSLAGTSFTSDMAIDDVTFYELIECYIINRHVRSK